MATKPDPAPDDMPADERAWREEQARLAELKRQLGTPQSRGNGTHAT